MTPQLQQAIKLLQLSNLELADYVEQELERNPLLEASAAEPEPERPTAERESEFEAPVSTETALTLSEDGPLPGRDGDLDTDYDNVYADESRSDAANDAAAIAPGPQGSDWQNVKSGGGGANDGEFSFESMLTREATLAEHLTEQLHMAIKEPRARMIGAFLIDQLDESGYLGITVADAAQQLDSDEKTVESVLARLQRFDPAGIFARDLREFIGDQSEDAPGELQAMAEICRQIIRRIEESPAAPVDVQARGETAKAG